MTAPRKFRDLAARLRDNNYHSSREILAATLLFNYSTILEALDKAGREPDLFAAQIIPLRQAEIPDVDPRELFTENGFALQAVDLASLTWKNDSDRIIHDDVVKRVIPYVLQAIVDLNDEDLGIVILDSIVVGVLAGIYDLQSAGPMTIIRQSRGIPEIQPGALELLVQRVRPRLERAIREIMREEFGQ